MEIVKMKLSELNPAEYNPRKALRPGDPAYEKLKASILSFGNVEPIVWNRSTGNVIGGHQRLRILLDLGVEESEVSVVELSEVDEKRLNIALNKITGEWDDEKLTSLLAELTAAGADRVLTMDLHAAQIQGFFDIPVDNLYGNPVFVDYYAKKFGEKCEEMVVVSPDVGSVSRARAFAQKLHMNLAIVDKRRQKANQCEVMNVIGDVEGKDCILFDDMVDTAGSLCNAAKAIVEVGGAKNVYACASHGVLSGPAIERINSSVITELAFLDTIAPIDPALSAKIKYLTVAPMFAEAIERIYQEISVSKLWI